MPISTLVIKLTADIAEFQSEFREATKAADKFRGEFQGIVGRVGALASGLAAGIGVAGVTSFVKGITDAASKTVDLSNKLGLSISAIQRLDFVAGQTGTTIDAFGNAIFELGTNLAGRDKSAVAAVEKLGFAFHELRRLKPEEQFEVLARALENVIDPQERNTLALALFGRQARAILPAIAEGYGKLADQARIASDEQVKALSDAGNAAKRAQSHFKTLAVEGLGAIVLGAEKAEVHMNKWAASIENSNLAMPGLIGHITRYNAELRLTAAAAAAAAAAQQAAFSRAPAVFTQPGLWDVGSRAAIATVGAAGGLDFKGILAISDELKRSTDTWQKATDATERWTDSLDALIAKWTGADLAIEVDRVSAAHAKLLKVGFPTMAALKGVAESAEDLRAKGAKLTPELFRLTVETGEFGKSVRTVTDVIPSGIFEIGRLGISMKDLAAHAQLTEGRLGSTLVPLGKLPGTVFEITKKAPDVKQFRIEFDELARSLSQLATIAGGTFGNVAQGLATVVAAADAAQKSVTQFKTGMDAFKAGKEIAGIAGIASGILGIAAAAIQAGIAIKNLFDRNKGRDLVVDFAASFDTSAAGTGFDELQAKLQEMGKEGERLWIKLTQGVGRNSPEQAKKVIGEVTAALDAFGTEAERARRRLDALGGAIDGVNRKAELFSSPFKVLIDSRATADTDEALDRITHKLVEIAQRGQAEFERLGLFVGATFAGMVRETGDVFGAITSLTPAFETLKKGVSDFGLTSTGVIDSLLDTFGLIKDETTGPILQSIQSTGQIFSGLQEAGYLTSSLFQTVGDDIGASFRDLQAKGGDVAAAMALSQPILQRLWEGQQIYGDITDETTRSLLEQAEKQGLVGAHMQDTNKKILDVLIEIRDIFGAKLPEAFGKTSKAAKDTASDIEREFSRIRIPDIKIGFDVADLVLPGSEIPHLAHGGIVRRPTLALIGEKGPEAVIPLSGRGGATSAIGKTGPSVVFQSGAVVINGNVDSDARAEQLVRDFAKVVRRGGSARTIALESLGIG